jgi:hypothetical protein
MPFARVLIVCRRDRRDIRRAAAWPLLSPKETMATKKRTTLRSKSGTKLYAERDQQGKFEDIQSYKKAHGQDVKRTSKAETASRKKAGASKEVI